MMFWKNLDKNIKKGFILNVIWFAALLMFFSKSTFYWPSVLFTSLIILIFTTIINLPMMIHFIKNFKKDKHIAYASIYSMILGFIITFTINSILFSSFCKVECVSYENVNGTYICKEFKKIEVKLNVPNNYNDCNVTEPNRCTVTSKEGKNIVTLDLYRCDNDYLIYDTYGDKIKCKYNITLKDSKNGYTIKYSDNVGLITNMDDIVTVESKKCFSQ